MKHLFPKKEIKEQMTPFKDLTLSQKASYIWGYYKYIMLASVLCVAAVISFVYAYQRNNYTTDCSIVIADGRITGYDTRTDAITTGFTSYLGIDGKKHRVEFDYNYSLIPQLFDDDPAVSADKIYLLASTASIDGYIASKDYIDYFSSDTEVFLTDLREILTTAELDKLSDKMIYYIKEDGTSIPIALDLSGTKIKTETDLTIETPCYGVIVTAPNPENAVAFIRYAFDL